MLRIMTSTQEREISKNFEQILPIYWMSLDLKHTELHCFPLVYFNFVSHMHNIYQNEGYV